MTGNLGPGSVGIITTLPTAALFRVLKRLGTFIVAELICLCLNGWNPTESWVVERVLECKASDLVLVLAEIHYYVGASV